MRSSLLTSLGCLAPAGQRLLLLAMVGVNNFRYPAAVYEFAVRALRGTVIQAFVTNMYISRKDLSAVDAYF